MIIHNTASGEQEEFKPIHSGRVNMFVCGPTVQDHFHVGHARTYIFFDALAKFLRASGYSVFYLQNITDIDDKIINTSREQGVDPSLLAEGYLEEYMREMKLLRVDSVNLYARATRHIEEIIGQAEKLVSKGAAYEAGDGVYFEVKKFSGYGEISGQNLEQIRHGVRNEVNEQKRNPEDFVLWKKMKPGEPYWDSPWGKGRPGWHIEDTAITELYLGEEYDIHGGGSDLVFPHHEAENAIERTLSGKEHLARYWIHTGMINLNSLKMSKSMKNYRTIDEVLKTYSPEVLRFAMLNAGYRTMIDFSDDMMQSSRENVEYITKVYRKLERISRESGNYQPDTAGIRESMQKAMENDFDTRSLITMLMNLCSEINSNMDSISAEASGKVIKLFDWADSFLCIIGRKREISDEKLIDSILEVRRLLREKKEYAISDKIRADLKANGIYIEDVNDRTEWWVGEE